MMMMININISFGQYGTFDDDYDYYYDDYFLENKTIPTNHADLSSSSVPNFKDTINGCINASYFYQVKCNFEPYRLPECRNIHDKMLKDIELSLSMCPTDLQSCYDINPVLQLLFKFMVGDSCHNSYQGEDCRIVTQLTSRYVSKYLTYCLMF